MTLGAMKEHSRTSVTEEQRRAGQKDQYLVYSGFSGNDTSPYFLGKSYTSLLFPAGS